MTSLDDALQQGDFYVAVTVSDCKFGWKPTFKPGRPLVESLESASNASRLLSKRELAHKRQALNWTDSAVSLLLKIQMEQGLEVVNVCFVEKHSTDCFWLTSDI